MSDQSRNIALVQRVYEEMWNLGRPALAGELFEEPEGVEKFVSRFLASFPDLQHTVEGMIEADGFVAVRFSAQGTHSGTWLDFAPSRRIIRYTGITWARITNGRIAKHHTEWDKAGLMDQLKA